MLCGCIPIGSAVASIPDIISNTGFILPKKDSSLLAEIVTQAIQSDKKYLSFAARNRIIDNYGIEKRTNELLSLLEDLINNR